jgi:AraC-like DNA-binding protein
MVITTQIKPAALLQPFVTCYALRTFDSGAEGILKPMFAVHESYMTLFLKGDSCKLCDIDGVPHSRISHSLVSLFTQSQGGTFYQGDFIIFSVQFKCNGISAIFGIPQRVLVNSILSLDDVLGPDAILLAEQLADQPDLDHMGNVMNDYLVARLLRQRINANTSTISAASGLILKNYGMISIDVLARYVNMSFRNFERRFTEEVGMPPKLYARITRFFTAIEDKAQHPYKTWTDITYQYNYFDQAHFIKEVKAFSFRTPEALFRTTPPVAEHYVSKVEY